MNIAIIGASGHYGLVLDVLDRVPGARLAGIAPGSEGESVEALRAHPAVQAHAAPFFEDYRTLLDRSAPDLAVVNCHFGDHARAGLEVLRRGLPLFIEKPVATTLDDLAALEAAHRRAGVPLAAMHALRYAPAFHTAWQAVGQGAIGEPRLLTAQKSYRLGRRPDFFRRRATCGGLIPWVGSHAVDWIRWFSGRPFLSVCAAHDRTGNRDHGELEASAACLFTLEGGAAATAHCDYLRPAAAPSHGDDRIRVAGTRGVIEVRHGRAFLLAEDQPGERELPVPADIGRTLFGDFAAAVRGEGRCLTDAADAFAVTRACLLARQSADEGRRIEFTPGTGR